MHSGLAQEGWDEGLRMFLRRFSRRDKFLSVLRHQIDVWPLFVKAIQNFVKLGPVGSRGVSDQVAVLSSEVDIVIDRVGINYVLLSVRLLEVLNIDARGAIMNFWKLIEFYQKQRARWQAQACVRFSDFRS